MELYALSDVGQLLVIGIIAGFGFGIFVMLIGYVIGFLFGLVRKA